MSKLDEIRLRLSSATPWPWFAETSALSYGGIACVCTMQQSKDSDADPLAGQIVRQADAELIANAPSDIEYLVRKLRLLTDRSCELWIIDDSGNQRRCDAAIKLCWPCRIRKECEK